MKKSKAAVQSLFTPEVAELVAIGAAIAANCEPCFKYHFAQARRLGISPKEMAKAVATAQGVKQAPARAVLDLANKILRMIFVSAKTYLPVRGTCCGASGKSKASSCCRNQRS
jgi:AhpD family alkylhydroperoxidase